MPHLATKYSHSGAVLSQGDPSALPCALMMGSFMIQSMQILMFLLSNECAVPKMVGRNIIRWITKYHNDPVTGKKVRMPRLTC